MDYSKQATISCLNHPPPISMNHHLFRLSTTSLNVPPVTMAMATMAPAAQGQQILEWHHQQQYFWRAMT